eukprot:SAG11_NODE_10853_length_801_cov_1.098291_1_plen_107_part_10
MVSATAEEFTSKCESAEEEKAMAVMELDELRESSTETEYRMREELRGLNRTKHREPRPFLTMACRAICRFEVGAAKSNVGRFTQSCGCSVVYWSCKCQCRYASTDGG